MPKGPIVVALAVFAAVGAVLRRLFLVAPPFQGSGGGVDIALLALVVIRSDLRAQGMGECREM